MRTDPAPDRAVRLAADIGGTFTDIVLESRSGRVTRKVLTTPRQPEQGVLDGAALALAEAGLGYLARMEALLFPSLHPCACPTPWMAGSSPAMTFSPVHGQMRLPWG